MVKGSQLTPPHPPLCISGVTRRTAHWTPHFTAWSSPRALWSLAGTVVLLLLLPFLTTAGWRCMERLCTAQNSRWTHRNYWYDLSSSTSLSAASQSPFHTSSVSQLFPQSSNNQSFVELMQWKHSCNVFHLLPAFKTCTDVQLRDEEREYAISLIWNESGIHNMKKNPLPFHELLVKAVFCEVCTAFVLCYTLSSLSYQWNLRIKCS